MLRKWLVESVIMIPRSWGFGMDLHPIVFPIWCLRMFPADKITISKGRNQYSHVYCDGSWMMVLMMMDRDDVFSFQIKGNGKAFHKSKGC